MTAMESSYMLSVKNVADILNISQRLSYTLFHRDDFPAMKIGSRFFVLEDRFNAWIESQESESERKQINGKNEKKKNHCANHKICN